MGSNPNIPLVCFAGTYAGHAIGDSPSAKECKRLARIFESNTTQNPCEVIYPGLSYGPHLQTVLEDPDMRKRLVLLHIAGVEPEGDKLQLEGNEHVLQVSLKSFTEMLGSLPNLRMVFLSGCSRPDWVRDLLAAGVPMVAALKPSQNPELFASIMYADLVRGSNFADAFDDAVEGAGEVIEFRELAIQKDSEVPVLEEEKETQNVLGLTVTANSRKALQRNLIGKDKAAGVSGFSEPGINGTGVKTAPRSNGNSDGSKPAVRRVKRVKRSTKPTQDTTAPMPGWKNRSVEPQVQKTNGRKIGLLVGGGIGIIGIAVVILSFFGFFSQFGAAAISSTCPMPLAGNSYNVLILPFTEGNCSDTEPKLYRQFIEQFAAAYNQDEVKLIIGTREGMICPVDEKDAAMIGDECMADLVIWAELGKSPFGEGKLIVHAFPSGNFQEQWFFSAEEGKYEVYQVEWEVNETAMVAPLSDMVKWSQGMLAVQAEKFELAQALLSPLQPVNSKARQLMQDILNKVGTGNANPSEIQNQLTSLPTETDPESPSTTDQPGGLPAEREGQLELLEFTKAIAQSPSSENYLNRGRQLQAMKRYREARSDFESALRLDAGNTEARQAVVEMHFVLKDFRKALRDTEVWITYRPHSTDAFLWKANIYLAQGDTTSAMAAFQNSLSKDAKNSKAYYSRGMAKQEQGFLDEAMDDMNQAIRYSPQYADALVARGILYSQMGNNKNAERDLRKALNIDKSNADAWARLGFVLYESGDEKGAAAYFDQAMRQGSNDEKLLLTLAELYLESSNSSLAAALLTHLDELNTSNIKLLKKKALLEEKAGLPGRALETYARIAILDPQSGEKVWLAQAELYSRLGEYSEAATVLEKAINTKPQSAELYCQLSLAYLSSGKVKKAMGVLDEAIGVDDNFAGNYLARGKVNANIGKKDLALDDFNKALQLEPGLGEAYDQRGLLEFKEKDYENAFADFNQAISLNPSLASAYNHRGNLSSKLGDYQSALKDYSRAIEEDPSLADAWYKRGFLYAMNEKYESAIRDIHKALELQPTNGMRHGQLAKIYATEGQKDQLYEHLDQALKYGYPVIELTFDPAFKPYKSERQFQELIARYDN